MTYRYVSSLAAVLFSGLVGSSASAQNPNPNYEAVPTESVGPRVEQRGYRQLVLDLNYAPSGEDQTGDGGGAALRFGRTYPLRYATFVPEFVGDYYAFSGRKTAQTYGASGGARLRFGRLFEPGMFAHFGVAGVHRKTDGDWAAPTLDVGLTFDFTNFERLLLGVQGEYKTAFAVGDNPSFTWYTAGISVGTKL